MFQIPPPLELVRTDTTGMSRETDQNKNWGRICMTCDVQLPEELPAFARQCEQCYKNPSTKRRCKKCNELKIPVTEPIWKSVCGSCYASSKFRECIICKEKKIREIDPIWRTVCSDCYKNKENFRECASCKQPNIKPGVASYLKVCGPCYKLSKAAQVLSTLPQAVVAK